MPSYRYYFGLVVVGHILSAVEAGGHTQVLGHSLEEEGLGAGPRSLGRIVVVAEDNTGPGDHQRAVDNSLLVPCYNIR